MKLSIITVCLNSAATIADTIKSVLQQRFKDYEYIIFDGGSTDQTISIVKSFGDKISLIRGNDKGIFDAMNQAIGYASGDFIGILNSDDFYNHPDVLTKVANTFDTTGTDSVYGDLLYVQRHNTEKIHRIWKAGAFDIRKFKFGWSVPHPTFFVRKKVYERYGVFDNTFKISGDYELVLRLLYKHGVSTAYIPDVLVKMRNNGNSDGNLKKRITSLMEDYSAWKKNGLKPGFYTIPLKPTRKIPQLFGAKLSFFNKNLS